MTDAERLQAIRDYVEGMYPVVRAAVLPSPEDRLRHEGFDEAARLYQADLLKLFLGSDTS